jgi:hypothetical protein
MASPFAICPATIVTVTIQRSGKRRQEPYLGMKSAEDREALQLDWKDALKHQAL